MSATKSRKKDKKNPEAKPTEDWKKELNIKYHDVNPDWNGTIPFFSRSTKQAKGGKK